MQILLKSMLYVKNNLHKYYLCWFLYYYTKRPTPCL